MKNKSWSNPQLKENKKTCQNLRKTSVDSLLGYKNGILQKRKGSLAGDKVTT